MLRLTALWAVFVAALILFIILREERLAGEGRVPLGRLRRLWLKKERRRAPRYRVDWLVRYQRTETIHVPISQTRDLSQTGVGLVARERLEVGSRVRMEFTVPGRSFPVSVIGQVMWNREVTSNSERLFFMGVQFYRMDPQTTAQLAEVLKTKGGVSR